MLLPMGWYGTIWGWKFARGFVVSIYIHEMGHVQALPRYGIKATAPMFIPGVGAFIRLKQYPTDRREDARVGLAFIRPKSVRRVRPPRLRRGRSGTAWDASRPPHRGGTCARLP